MNDNFYKKKGQKENRKRCRNLKINALNENCENEIQKYYFMI